MTFGLAHLTNSLISVCSLRADSKKPLEQLTLKKYWIQT